MHQIPFIKQTTDFPLVKRSNVAILQINMTLKCNQACLHCHVNSSPKRTEMMEDEVIEHIINILTQRKIETLDITGGAPELHPRFRELIQIADEHNIHVIDRCNLTIRYETGQDDLFDYFAAKKVEVVASLPCYLESHVNAQRGDGVFQKSIRALRELNKKGYADGQNSLILNLVYNPQGPYLPPEQETLKAEYKEHLYHEYGIKFNNLYTLCNMPIQRFGSSLISNKQYDDYMNLLKSNYRKENLQSVMCKSLISVDWQGYVYDCDFNQMLNLYRVQNNKAVHIRDYDFSKSHHEHIIVKDHCYACTAGQGSSCGGALQ